MKPRWTGATLLAAAFALALLPMTANAAPLPAPAPLSPTAGATVDQPVFSWQPVDGAASYEIEVALDDQFVTVTDPGDEVAPRTVNGTTYVPTYSYTAKTHYWHVRAVSADGAKGTWSAAREFTRRWTNDDEAAGVEQVSPASRVENLRLLTGDDTPALDQVGLEWDPVPGAAFYQVQIGTVDGSAQMLCTTPHAALIPPFEGSYAPRSPLGTCSALSPLRAWVEGSAWSEPTPGTVSIEGSGVRTGDLVYVRFLNQAGSHEVLAPSPAVVASTSTEPDAFTVSGIAVPGDLDSKVQYFVVALPVEAHQSYYARVRAVDVDSADYPGGGVYSMWSDERREPGEPLPTDVTFTPVGPRSGTGSLSLPVIPDALNIAGSDTPALGWEPVTDAVAYRVTIALDRDFTNRVGRYTSRGTVFVPPEVYDDLGASRTYFWFATPCTYADVSQTEVSCGVRDRLAINNPAHVGRFSKQSVPVTGLAAATRDSQTNALVSWGDALTAARTVDPTFTPGGVKNYEVQFTAGEWADAVSVVTDNLAYSTAAAEPLGSGTYRWRVRPLDGQGVPLAWAYGPDFTIVKPDGPKPSPSQSSTSPNPSASASLPGAGSEPTGPPPVYQPPAPAEGTAAALPPEKPGTPVAKRVSKRKVRVHWRASEELGEPVTEYLVYRSTDGNRFAIAKRTTARATKIKAARGKPHWFYVVADSDAGRSDPSATVKFSK